MNQKIKELAKQATIHFEEGKDNRIHYVQTTTLSKFAELIIKECVSFADAGTAYAVSTAIKEHFEIKEPS